MNDLPEEIIHKIYKNVHTSLVLPELESKLKIVRIEQCVKIYPFIKSLSFIATYTNVDYQTTLYIINNNTNIYRIFNNLYNTTFYYHKDNMYINI